MFLVSALAKKMPKRLNSQQLQKLIFQEKEKVYFCSRKKRNVALNKKVIFVFLTIFKLGFQYDPQMSVLFFHFFSFILVFNKSVIERILILPYSYKSQKIKKMNERKSLAYQIVASEYIAEQIISLILQLGLRRFYCLMFEPSRKLQYSVV